ncbi:MAG TPA: hypothetical protein VK308_08145, partial [Pyrinomonadaceae bacterium]|nr:hypothetical protein [Pyrinomonadaceae bacterium]
EIKRLEKDEQRERAEAEKSELDLREAEKIHQAKLKELNEVETKLEAERADVLQHTAAFERLTEIARQLENTIERLTERAEGLQREGERARSAFAEHQKETGKLEKTLEKERVKVEKLHAEKQGILEESKHARNELNVSEKIAKELREEFSRKYNRLETLKELEEKKTVYAPSVQKLFAEQKRIGVKFIGTLADKLNVSERAEKAVENLFGAFLQTVLVESETDARKTIRFLNENNLGRIAVLVVQSAKSKIQRAKSKSKDDIANLIGVSDEFAEVLSEIFPREMAARLVESFDQVKVGKDEAFVNFDGDLLVGGKLFIGGQTGSNEKNTSLLAFKRELRELENETQKLNVAVEKSEKETAEARAVLADKENKLVDLQSFIVKIERELLSVEIQAKTSAQETERAERHLKVVGEEAKQIETEISEIESRQKEAKLNAAKAETARSRASENLAEISKELNEARMKVNAENEVLNEKRTLAATSGERRRSTQNALKRIENEQTELESRIARHNLEISETESKAKELEKSIAEIERKITVAETDQTSEQNELTEMAAHLKLAREQADAMAAELAELNKRSADARNERAAIEIRQAEAVTRLKNLNEKCVQELNVSLVELMESETVESDFDLETARQTVEDLREKIENFGAINMLALEELSETEERLTFLTAQRQDIVDGITAAEAALKEIKQRSRERFREAFEAINRNFIEFFQEL